MSESDFRPSVEDLIEGIDIPELSITLGEAVIEGLEGMI